MRLTTLALASVALFGCKKPGSAFVGTYTGDGTFAAYKAAGEMPSTVMPNAKLDVTTEMQKDDKYKYVSTFTGGPFAKACAMKSLLPVDPNETTFDVIFENHDCDITVDGQSRVATLGGFAKLNSGVLDVSLNGETDAKPISYKFNGKR